MTVYVDDMQMTARVGRINGRWSHLMADTRQELIDFGAKIGMRPSWLQDKRSGVHFDVTEPKRQAALLLGAVPIECSSPTWREVVKKARAQHRETHPDCDLTCGQRRQRA